MKLISVLYNKFVYRPLIKKKLGKVGKNFRLGYSSELLTPEFFSIGDNYYSGPYGYFGTNKNNPVVIGNHVMLGPFCKIIGGNHDYKFTKNHMCYNQNIDHMNTTIIIEDGVWIGSGTVILSNSKICEGSVIGAMSLVVNYIPPYCIAVGNPAKKIRKRFNESNQLKELISNVKSKYSFQEINDIYKTFAIDYKE